MTVESPIRFSCTVKVLYNSEFMARPVREPVECDLEHIHSEVIDLHDGTDEREFITRFITDLNFREEILTTTAEHFFECFNIGALRRSAPRSMSVGDLIRFTIFETTYNMLCDTTGWRFVSIDWTAC